MQEVGPKQGGGVFQDANQGAGVKQSNVDDFRRSTSRPVATKDIEQTNHQQEINGIKINFGKLDPSLLSNFSSKIYKDANGELMLKLGDKHFKINSDTDRIDFSIGEAGELKIKVVDKAKEGFVSSREVSVSKEGSIRIGAAQKTPVVVESQNGAETRREIKFNIPQQQRDEIFYAAKERAEKLLQKQFPGCELVVEGSGNVAKDMMVQPSIDPMELQTFTLIKADGSKIKLGNILPEKIHLQTLKSSDELTSEILALARERAGFQMPQSTIQAANGGVGIQSEIPFTLPQSQIDKLFFDGLTQAEAMLRKQFPGGDLIAEASGTLAKDIELRKINPIEYQAILFITKDNQEINLGRVLPEKIHLQSLKSSEEIRDEILKLAKEKLGYK